MAFGIFSTKSTYQIDYVQHRLSSPVKSLTDKPDYPKIEKQEEKFIQKDLSTLKPFQADVYVPFDLFYRPKSCVTTNPFEEFRYKRKDESNEFLERLKVRKTRPRVFMIPQISLDDVDQDLMYKKDGLCDNIYTSDWKIATEFTSDFASKSISDVSPNYKPRSVSFKATEFCTPIEPGMQKFSQDWDQLQLRATMDPTDLFWSKNVELGKCSVCKPKDQDKLSQEEHDEIDELVSTNGLRLPYQLKTPGYSGYVPEIATNIKPKRILFKRMEPWLSSNMVIQGVYKK